MKPQSAGGKVMAIRQRKAALVRYYKDPNFCKNCETMIKVREKEKVPTTRRRKFCTRSCGASYNNKFRKREKILKLCSGCKAPISRKATKCVKCHGNSLVSVDALTKGELIARSKYWVQYRAVVAKNARRVYKNSGEKYACDLCGYDIHVEIGHIKDVKDFPESATVGEINNIKNLVPLCPNHHWEFDHDLLQINGLRRSE